MSMEKSKLGLAGKLAQSFIQSRLTPILALVAILLGALAVAKLPREEEPQIHVPMFDIFVPFPGATPKEVEERVIKVGERKLWEIPDVEYIYTTAEPGFALFIVRFKVGTNPETAMTRVYTKFFANVDLLPQGTKNPLIKPRSIDDVPIVSLTLTGGKDGLSLRRAAVVIRDEINAIQDVSITELIGGRRRQFHVYFDPDALRRRHLMISDIKNLIQSSNVRFPAGTISTLSNRIGVETDSFIRSSEELEGLVVGVSEGDPVQLKDVARIVDGPDEEEKEVYLNEKPAVTLAISKRPGANATNLAHEILERAENILERDFSDVKLTVTRNYGHTAQEKSDELLFHVLLATFSVTLLIIFALGYREGIVVLVAVPVTLALTLLIFFLLGYTLNRITLFALIFSIGILVDDAIVVVENIHRHAVMKKKKSLTEIAVEAVAEVGNPTILATWTVIAAILPMAFVGGLMGPYMRPIPVGASVAMLFSLGVAFIISPWAFIRLLQIFPKTKGHGVHKEGRLDQLYRKWMKPLLVNNKVRLFYFFVIVLLLAGSVALVPLKRVVVKMLPFDDKDEFEVVINMPEDSVLASTRQAAEEMARELKSIEEVEDTVSYIGTAAPYNFNGLVRHYFLRQRPHYAQVHVLLSPRKERKRKSHAIAKEARSLLKPLIKKFNARVQVAEVPPGPPVLSTLVLEVYGPDSALRERMARAIQTLLLESSGITDVDIYVPETQPKYRLAVDHVKTSLNGIAPVMVADALSTAIDGQTVGLAHLEAEREPVEIRLRLSATKRNLKTVTEKLSLFSYSGQSIPVKKLTKTLKEEEDKPQYHKNLLPVTYVIADVGGRLESPIYALLDLRPKIQKLGEELGVPITQYFAQLPKSSNEWGVKWDGEWHITYEVFRDLGIAFAIVLILMYVLIVYWFESFTIPIVIMIPIPLTLVGILPAHWGMGAFFTATSMIGFIAGAGVVVRNSIILVDFIQLRLKEGSTIEEAVIDAGAVRFRPMLLTAAAVAVGAGVILFDPIFQGLALSLIAGEAASTLLSRTAVPVLYHLFTKRGWIGLTQKQD
ncbi:multidrug transporter AcrB [bacterium F11]|nr:multidrug transporter AcrB [bacterium F11]